MSPTAMILVDVAVSSGVDWDQMTEWGNRRAQTRRQHKRENTRGGSMHEYGPHFLDFRHHDAGIDHCWIFGQEKQDCKLACIAWMGFR